jgi:hypothetical protein
MLYPWKVACAVEEVYYTYGRALLKSTVDGTVSNNYPKLCYSRRVKLIGRSGNKKFNII